MPETIEHSLDYNSQLDQIATAITESYGISPEITSIGVEWARDWLYGIMALPTSELSRDTIMVVRDQVLDGLPVPRDSTENRPTLRVRYAAKQALYAMAGAKGDELRTILEGNTPQIIPDFERIDSVLTTLLETYRQAGYPYSLDSTRVPQDPRHMPRNLELDPERRTSEQAIQLASFWFADCYYMRGVNDSNDMTINLAALHEDHPEVFDFNVAATMEPSAVERLLLDYHLAVQHKQTSEHWVENAKRMVERYDGNPLNIFENTATYQELVDRIRNDGKGGGFKGFQKKMTSMISYYYMANGLIPYKNHPLPVDFHVIRLSVSNELVKFDNLPENGQIPFDATTDFLREVFYDFADHHDISQLELCDVVWLFSRELCSRAPGNTMRQLGEYAARNTNLTPTLTDKNSATHQQHEKYSLSCGICPIEATCVHNVPSARYYKHGIVTLPDPRIRLEHPQNNLHEGKIAPVSRPVTEHAIDTRKANRDAMRQKRIRLIQALAHPASFNLSPDEENQASDTLVPSNGDPGSSLSGKKFGFSDKEITLALGTEPSNEELAAIQPYRARIRPQ